MAELSEQFCTEFEKALADGRNLPPKAALDLCMEVIWKYKQAYKFTGPCDVFLTHPENRSRLMLSARNAHKLAEQIHLSGADYAQLGNALCFEIAIDATKKKSQLDKNRALILRSGGLLAEISGAERFITVGCGHTAGICKHAEAGGRTSSKILQDSNGYMDVAKLKKNATFKKMLEVGWEWTCIKSAVDFAYPQFAKLAQQACNSSNSNRQQTSEPELVCQLADYYKHAKDAGEADPKAAALSALQEQSRCAAYAYVLLSYALDFGGGDDVPYIRFLDAIAKEYGTSKEFGESFWDKVRTMKFPQNKKEATQHYPLLRLALLVAQACTNKQKDEIASFLTIADLKSVVSKQSAGLAQELEKLLTTAFKFTEVIDKNFLVNYQTAVGLLMVRVGMMMTKKESKGPEGRTYTIQELKQAYLDDLSKAAGQVVTYAPWSATPETAATAATPANDDVKPHAATPVDSDFKDLSSYTSIEGQAKGIGYSVGAVIVEKGTEDASNYWTITEMLNQETIILQRVFDYSGTVPQDKIKIDIDVMKSRWRVVKEPTIPSLITQKQQRPTDAFQLEILRGEAFKALVAADKAASKKTDQGIAFWTDPSAIRTTRKLAAGELTLIPMVNINMITNKNNSSGTAIRICEDPLDLFIHQLPKQVPLKKGTKELAEDQIAAAFWVVSASSTTDANEANMEEIVVNKSGFDFKALTNGAEIDEFKQLLVYKAPEAKTVVASKLVGACRYDPEVKRRRTDKQTL